ncbi:MAG: AsnC family transcriptional regulator [Novosphingobium sp. 32-60-15]|uniref:Lrp/AsnC family transcriptional regulator n=1 Tax=unclassified Novosphingobium TaxID=2644732 RepID=UPI000BCA736F|nr:MULTISPECIES: Lrp/AsnC family transcriptional regulator [unclassified Novosphingobium]OYX60421.1 MAG: AsnC family transcriptional regulator [Novosphingobium sp. 32-60-15]
MPMETPEYPTTDQLDRDIALMLAQDARLSFRKIAADLGVTEGTVRGRVKRLQGAGLLKLVPIIDIDRARDAGTGGQGSGQHMMFVTVRCASGKLNHVREALLAIPQVSALYDANATPRLVAVCILPSLDDAAIVMNQILSLDGIREAESELVLQSVKYNAAIGPIATLEDLTRQSTD